MKYQQLVAMPASVQDWLDHELEMRGIDADVYTRYILSILQQENCEGEPTLDRELFANINKRNFKDPPVGKSKGKSKLRTDRSECEEMKKSAAVECLMSVSEQKFGIEKLVDDLCDKLKNIQGNGSGKNDLHNEKLMDRKTAIDICSLETSSLQEEAENYSAFPHPGGIIEPSAEPEPTNQIENNVRKSMWEMKSPDQSEIMTKHKETNKANDYRNELETTLTCSELDRNSDLNSEDIGQDGFNPMNLDDFTIRFLPQLNKVPSAMSNFRWMQDQNFQENSKEKEVEGNVREKENCDGGIGAGEIEENLIADGRDKEVGDGEADLLAKLAAKFNPDMASIWSARRGESKSIEDIWKVLPFHDSRGGEKEIVGREQLELTASDSSLTYGREFVWPCSVGVRKDTPPPSMLFIEDNISSEAGITGYGSDANEPGYDTRDLWIEDTGLKKSNEWNKEFCSSLSTLEINCSQPDIVSIEPETTGSVLRSPSCKEDLQLIWEALGNLGNALESDSNLSDGATSSSFGPVNFLDSGMLDGRFVCGKENVSKENWDQLKDEISKEGDKMINMHMIWKSDEISPPSQPEQFENEKLNMWQTDGEGIVEKAHRVNGYIYRSNEDDEDPANALQASRKCTLTYHKGESRFVEVKPSRAKWNDNKKSLVPLANNLGDANEDYDSEESGENLLTSPKTHFRPIRQDSCETDTTAGSSDVGEDATGYGNDGCESSPSQQAPPKPLPQKQTFPAFLNEDNEESSDESSFFPVCLNSTARNDNREKFCQTDDVLNATNGGETDDSCTQMLNAVIDVLDSMLGDQDPVKGEDGLRLNRAMNLTDTNSSSPSVSPSSSLDDTEEILSASPSSPKFENALIGMWDAIKSEQPHGEVDLCKPKWSTASDEDRELYWLCGNASAVAACDGMQSWCEALSEKEKKKHESEKVKMLRDEMREEEEKLFEDIDQLRSLNLIKDAGDCESHDRQNDGCVMAACEWMESQFGLKMPLAERCKDKGCLEFEMLQHGQTIHPSSDGEEAVALQGDVYSDYLLELQKVDSFVDAKLPAVPNSKVLYSVDLEEEWRKSRESLDIPIKSKCKQKSAYLKRPCSFYLEGNCRRSDCKFSHDLASITCRFWEEGSCFKGATCPFLHGYQRDKSNNEKPDFNLELESEAHFPALSKTKYSHRKKEFVQSSSSDSTPITKSKRQRKRFSSLKDRAAGLSPTAAARQAKPTRQKNKCSPKTSSSEDDLMDI